MEIGSSKDTRLILLAIVVLCVLQLSMLIYLKKKFDDSIGLWWNRQNIVIDDFKHLEKVILDKEAQSAVKSAAPASAVK